MTVGGVALKKNSSIFISFPFNRFHKAVSQHFTLRLHYSLSIHSQLRKNKASYECLQSLYDALHWEPLSNITRVIFHNLARSHRPATPWKRGWQRSNNVFWLDSLKPGNRAAQLCKKKKKPCDAEPMQGHKTPLRL